MRLRRALCLFLVATVGGCLGDTGPDGGNGNGGSSSFGSIFVLNSVGQTIGRFDVEGDELVRAADPIVLPPNFDGDALTVQVEGFATSISSFGGSQILLGSLRTGEQTVITFPGAQGAEANPSKVTLLDDPFLGVEGWVAGRASNTLYRIAPGAETAITVATDVGEFVERVLPFSSFLAAVDANLDDEGGTFEPLGPPRVLIVDRTTGDLRFVIELSDAAGASDAIFNQGDIFVLAGGSFSEDAGGGFVPDGNGALVIASVNTLGVRRHLPIDGNGISLAPGADASLYVTRTSDFESMDVLVYDVFRDEWDRSPDNPIRPRDADGAAVDCWVVSALRDGRLLCATFSVPTPGRLYLLDETGGELSSLESGVGSTDIVVR